MGKTHKCVGLPFSHASTVLRQEFTETTENLFWGLQILFISNHMCTLKLIIFILFLKTIYCHCEAYCERERSWDLIRCPKKQPVPQVIISFLSLLTTFSMLLCLSRWTTILFFSLQSVTTSLSRLLIIFSWHMSLLWICLQLNLFWFCVCAFEFK